MKKGFTLIEIMVTIVIMGVLAAIAVPKLFGYIAKAKASEIHSAAGTYIHLQDAYLGNKPGPGSWSDIGYTAPGNGTTQVFCYNSGNLDHAVLVDEIPENTIGWAASNIINLNECSKGSWWSIVITPKGNNDVNYTLNVNSGICGSLTSGWNQGLTMSGSCTSTSVNKPETPASSAAPEPASSAAQKPEEPASSSAPKQEEPVTPPAPQPPATVQDALNDIENAKLAFTSHKGGQSDEKGKQLKKAWDDAVARCEAAFGKKNCNASGKK